MTATDAALQHSLLLFREHFFEPSTRLLESRAASVTA